MDQYLQLNEGAEAGDVGAQAGDIGAEGGTHEAGEGLGGEATNQEGGEKSGVTDKEPTELEKLQATVADLEGKNKDMATKMGKQSKEVGLARKIEQAMRTNPEAALKKFAKELGVDATFGAGKSPVDLAKQFSEGTPQDQETAMNAMVDQKVAEALQTHVAPRLTALAEIDNANQFKDWDDHADTRQMLDQAIQTGAMSKDQLNHHAARGFHLDQALTAAREEGKAEYRAELERKNQEQISTGGNQEKGGGAGKVMDFANVVGQLADH